MKDMSLLLDYQHPLIKSSLLFSCAFAISAYIVRSPTFATISGLSYVLYLGADYIHGDILQNIVNDAKGASELLQQIPALKEAGMGFKTHVTEVCQEMQSMHPLLDCTEEGSNL